MPVNLLTQSKASSMEVRKNDLYETPIEAIRPLLDTGIVPKRIWEPSCGPGAICKALKDRGHQVYGSDIIDYETEHQQAIIDFHQENVTADFEYDAILTNPPYHKVNDYIRMARKRSDKVFLLLRLAFLEGSTRNDLIDCGNLQVYLFRNRLPFMHRYDYDGPKQSSSAMAFAWFVWNNEYNGPIIVHRINKY